MAASTAMSNLAWRACYETGIASIDAQHQSLFKALRYLHKAIYEGGVHAEVGVVLEFLEQYCQIHFTEEEAYMKQLRFPGLLEHMAEHRTFWIQIQDLRARYAAETPEVSMEASLLLFAWFRDHILVQDMAFARHARLSGLY